MDKRKLVLDKYGISSKRYKELCGFCEQYPDWKKLLIHKTDTLKSKEITDMPVAFGGKSDQTSDLAIKRAVIQEKCDLIERVAREAGDDLYPYIIQSVCYNESLSYLMTMMKMPCSRSAFYDRRRYFFFLLDKYKN